MSKINESIVLIGGGSGVYGIARHLKHVRSNITTIQTMFDHGGHSGKLRDERGMLPPGDIRRALLALADENIEESLRILMTSRFKENGSSIDDVSLGNLMFTALVEHYGNWILAINALCRLFNVKGKVLPISLDHAELCATLTDGSVVKGEGYIDTRSPDDDRRIVSVHLEPQANIYLGAYEAIVQADKIVFCPGDLFTSIIPNTLVTGFQEAIDQTEAQLIYITNLMTKKAETHRYTASMFAKNVLALIGREKFDTVICSSSVIKLEILAEYLKEKSECVVIDEALANYAHTIIQDDIADQTGDVLRHSQKVVAHICAL